MERSQSRKMADSPMTPMRTLAIILVLLNFFSSLGDYVGGATNTFAHDKNRASYDPIRELMISQYDVIRDVCR